MIEEKYTCPRCGFAFKLEPIVDGLHQINRCMKCDKGMNIQNGLDKKTPNILKRKVHYLHKSLLN